MADAQESTGQESSGPLLEPNDILAVVQRTLLELNAYCGNHPSQVDRNVCMAALEKCATWLGYFPPLHAPADAPEQRAN